MREVILHIGMPKTGTTAIQEFLAARRKELLDLGVVYPAVATNHGPFLCRCVEAGADARQRERRRVKRRVTVGFEPEVERERLESILRSNPGETVVFSGEILSALEEEEVERLRALLEPSGARVRVLLYVREPLAYAASMMQQRLKNGKRLGRRPSCSNADESFRKYAAVFGEENVEVRLFDRSRFPDGDVTGDILEAIGLEPGAIPGGTDRDFRSVNRALSHEACLLLDAINESEPPLRDGDPNPRRSPALVEHLQRVRGGKFSIDPDCLGGEEERFREFRLWLEEKVGPVEAAAGEGGQPGPWSEETISSLAELLNDLSRTAARVEAEEVLREARGELFRGRFANGGRRLLEAVRLDPELRRRWWVRAALGLSGSRAVVDLASRSK